jgi:Domain of unknown function (DUF4252)
MSRSSHPPRRRPSTVALLALVLAVLCGALAGPAAAQERERRLPPRAGSELRGTPGFVDFAELGVDPPGELTVGVSLSGPILRLVAEATRGEEPGFAELIDKLRGIFAKVYQVPDGDRSSIEKLTRSTVRRLESRGWHTVFEIHDDGESSYLQVRTDGELIQGLAVVFLQQDGTVGFINVVGDITPDEVGRIGRTFDIDALERFEKPDKDD